MQSRVIKRFNKQNNSIVLFFNFIENQIITFIKEIIFLNTGN